MTRSVPVCHQTLNPYDDGLPCVGPSCSAARTLPGNAAAMFCGLVYPAPYVPPESECWDPAAKETPK